MIDLYMVEDDTAPDRVFTIKRDGVVVNLTGATVALILRDTSTQLITNTGHQACIVNVDPTTGIVTYSFATGDVGTANVHLGDLQITYSDGKIETEYDYICIHVRPKAGTVS